MEYYCVFSGTICGTAYSTIFALAHINIQLVCHSHGVGKWLNAREYVLVWSVIWFNKSCAMCYHAYVTMHLRDRLLSVEREWLAYRKQASVCPSTACVC